MKKSCSAIVPQAQENLDREVIADQFAGCAASFNDKASSKEKALAILTREGISTPRGKLTKRYS